MCYRASSTADTWLRSVFGAKQAEALSEILIGFLPEPRDVSLLHALFYLHSNGGFAGILGIDGPAHDSEIFVEGAHSITERLAESLQGAVHLGAPVREVQHNEKGVTVLATGAVVRAGHAIVTLPPVLAGRLYWHPAIPPDRDYLTQRMPIRGKIVAAALFDAPFWRGAGACAGFASENVFAWDEGGEERPAAITILASIRRSREVWLMPEADRKAALLSDLAALVGPGAYHATAFHLVYWAAEPWSRGCNSFLTTGAWTSLGHTLRQPVGRVIWAGAEVSEHFVGQMEGAVRTAETAAAKIIGASN